MWFERAKELINNVEGDISLIVKNLNTGETFSYREDEVFPSASIIKIPILMTLVEHVQDGKLDINEAYRIGDERIVGGAGIILYLSDLPYTLLDYATLMTDLSDNTATNKLIDILGLEAIAETCKAIGLQDTVLSRKLMHLDGINKTLKNLTSGRDMLKTFEWMHNNPERYELAIKILKQQLLNDLLPTYTEQTYDFAHKTGMITGTRHDVGIMYLKDPIFVSFLSKDLKDGMDGVRLANELGVMIVEEFNKEA